VPVIVAIAAALGLAAAVFAQAGLTWKTPLEIAVGGGVRGPWQQNESKFDYVDDASVALDARGAAAVAWVDQRRKDVLFQVFDATGAARFRTPVNVSRSPGVFSWLPRVVVSRAHPGVFYLLWQEIVFSGGSHGGDIFFSRSPDGGRYFAKPINLSSSKPGDGKGRITKDIWHNGSFDLVEGLDGAVYVAWTEYEGPLWFTRSTNGGASFSNPVRIAGAAPAKPARAPALATAADGSVYLAWTLGEDDGADIRIAKSTDGGRTFGDATVVSKTPAYSDAPKLAVDRAGTVHVVHGESAGGPFDRYHVRYTRSRDGGRTFEPQRDVSSPHPQGAQSAAFPMLALDERGGVYVTWELFPDYRAAPRGLGVAMSRDRGDTFSAPALVPGSIDARGGANGSQQGRLMQKLAVNGSTIAVANSSLKDGDRSRVWLMRGELSP
jgi:hypothetical protein